MLAGWFLWLPLRVIGSVWFNVILRVKKWAPEDMAERVLRIVGLLLMGAVLIGVESLPVHWLICRAAAAPGALGREVAAAFAGVVFVMFSWLPLMVVGTETRQVKWKWMPDWYTDETNN